MKSFSSGLDNLATANNSLVSLYKPTVVIYVVGELINNGNNELLAVAKLSKPLEKDFTKEALVRVKLDF